MQFPSMLNMIKLTLTQPLTTIALSKKFQIAFFFMSVMQRIVKFHQICQNFIFLHICCVEKSEIPVHDGFFLHIYIGDIGDKYQVCGQDSCRNCLKFITQVCSSLNHFLCLFLLLSLLLPLSHYLSLSLSSRTFGQDSWRREKLFEVYHQSLLVFKPLSQGQPTLEWISGGICTFSLFFSYASSSTLYPCQ